MARARACRYLGAVLALLCATMARAEGPSGNSCGATTDTRVEDARLVIVPDEKAGLLRLTLSGRAVVSNAVRVQGRPAAMLCSATIGDALAIDDNHLCDSFQGAGGGFSGQDKIRQDNDAFTFELTGSTAYSGGGIRIVRPPHAGICAEQLVVEVRPGSNNHFAEISNIPQYLGADRAEFLLHPGLRTDPFDVYLRIDPDSQADVRANRPMYSPNSWGTPIEGVRLQSILKALLLSFVIAVLFTYFERKHRSRSAFGSAPDWLRTPLTIAMAFYSAAALMDCASDASSLLLDGTPAAYEPLSEIIEYLSSSIGGYDRMPLEAMLLVAFIPICFVICGIGRLLCRLIPRFTAMVAFPLRAMLYGSVIAALAYLFATVVRLVEQPLKPAGFETPALAISMFYTLVAVHSLRKLFDLSWSWIAGIALIVAITAFYPSEPVISSSQPNVSIGYNTAIWARFLCHPVANFLYVAALAGFAFNVAKSRVLEDELVMRWLIFLLILQIAWFSIGDPTNALAVMGVVLIAPVWLLAPVAAPVEVRDEFYAELYARHARTRPRPAIDWIRPRESFAFVVGGVAAFIFLMQFIFEAGGTAAHHKFALLGLANVPRTFAIGYCAGLVLAQAGPRLRGDSATSKAANIALLIFLTNIASALVFLQGRERLMGALASSLGVIAALILSAMIVYDIERARANDGHLEWRDLFKGTTLARGIPIVSAVAAAVFSALSPIFVHEIGDAFGAVLKIALPQVAGGSG